MIQKSMLHRLGGGLETNSQLTKIILNIFIASILAILLISCGGSCPSYNPTNAVVFMDSNDGGVANGATNVSRTPSIVIGFQSPVDPSTVNSNTIYLSKESDGSNPIAITNLVADPTNKTFTFNLAVPLEADTQYYVIVKDDVKFANGSSVPNTTFDFTTGSDSVPMVSILSPLNGTTSNSTTPAIQFKFSNAVTNVDWSTVKLLDENGNEVPLGNIIAGDNNTFTVNPLNALNTNAKYKVVIAGVTDTNSTSIASTEFEFTTGASSTPTVAMLSPSNNAESVSQSPLIQFKFSESVTNVDSSTVKIFDENGNEVPLGNIIAGNDNTYTVNPLNALNPNAKYKVVITGVKDVDGNSTSQEFSFATGAISNPTVAMLSPGNNAESISLTPAIQFKFSESVTNVYPNTVKLLDESGNAVPLGSIVAGNDNTFTVSPLTPLNPNAKYKLVIDGVTDTDNNNVIPKEFEFTTGTVTTPTVTMLSPSDNAESVSQSPLIQFKFSESVTNVDSSTVKLFDENGNEVPLGDIVAGNDNTFVVSLENALNPNAKYSMVISGVTDVNNNISNPSIMNFTTGTSSNPTVMMRSPANNAIDIGVNESMQLLFSESVQNVNTTNVVLHSGSPTGNVVPISIQSTGNTSYAVIPVESLVYGTTYYLTLNSAITNVANNNPLIPVVFSFSTTSGISQNVIYNLTPITFRNGLSGPVNITSITTNNPDVIVSPNGTCIGRTTPSGGSCGFIINALGVTTDTPTTITMNFSDGSSKTYNVLAVPPSYEANFDVNSARYVLIRYVWNTGDFDIAAGFASINPSVGDFPIYAGSTDFVNCLGYFCGGSREITYNSSAILKWAGDNTQSGQENILIDTWALPTGTSSFNFAVSGAWYSTIGNPSTTTVVFETYPDGTVWTLDVANRSFLPNTDYIDMGSSAADVTWAGRNNSRMLSSTLAGLTCTYASPTVTGQANNGTCQFIGNQSNI